MKKIILFFLFLALPAALQARPVGVQWNHEGADGFKIYEHVGDGIDFVMLVDGELRTTEIQVPDDGEYHTYMITAYNGSPETGPESGYSDPLTIDPEKVLPEVPEPPGKVYTFTIAGSVSVSSE